MELLGAAQGAALVIFFISIIISLNQGISGRMYVPAVEVDALLEFKATYISKASQHLLLSWNSSSTSTVCESWVGISCTTSASDHRLHILAVNLPSFELAGSLAPDLGNLSFLSILNFSQNSFTGSIPSELQGCTSLTLLDLAHNSLAGDIPSSLSSLSSLKVLTLCYNNLSGYIPPAILSNCTSLEKLSLCSNALTGSIPADLCLHLPNLQFLLLWGNHLTGNIPPSLGNCTSLLVLFLWENHFSGNIPPSLGNCTSLTVLAIGENQLTGPIPRSLGNCTSLNIFDSHSNQLTGSIPSELGFINNLQGLYLGNNSLTGVIPSILANFTDLNLLDLGFNKLIGPVPAELGFLSHLGTLSLHSNNLTGAIPPNLGMCTDLIDLNLAGNQLTGPIPGELGQLRHLKQLWLGENMLSGVIPLSLRNCTNLQIISLPDNQLSGSISQIDFSNWVALVGLDLGVNQLTGEIPWHTLTNCTSLYFLNLSSNYLIGGIPSILGKLAELKYVYLYRNLLQGGIPNFLDYMSLTLLDFDLSFNRLNGSLPSSGLANALSTLTTSLNLSHNQLSGSLPLWLGQLVQVQAIDLSNNNFVGDIPQTLGNCANLFALNLSINRLAGDLPLQLENLTNMNSLDLSNNNFSGALPSYLGTELHNLQFLDVSFNNFTGRIPTHEGVFMHLNASSFQGNPGLCGPILKRECIDMQLSKNQHHHSYWQLRSWRPILLMALISLILLPVVVMLLLKVWRYSLIPRGNVTYNHFIGNLAGAKRYSAHELMEATQGYSENNLLGQGGLSVVYKGVLTNGMMVAVKKLKDVHNGFHEGLLQEMQILGKLRHRNLVQVLGCVFNLDVKALVLEYMANGSLEQYLNMHQEHSHVVEEMASRFGSSYWEMVTRVAISIGKALAYLHHEYDVPIIHGDVKPSNILLDSDMEPHLADFGLAKLIVRGVQAVTLTFEFKGSIGYMAPEYALAARITTKVDVYAYGVVLLGMLTGRRPTQIVPVGLNLHEWVKSKMPSNSSNYYSIANAEDLLDPSLLERITPSTDLENSTYIRGLLQMGLACTMDNPNDRPNIRQVLGFLEHFNLN